MSAVEPSVTSDLGAASLLIVRHGQSEWNAVRRWQGTADPPLTDLGRTQARQAAEQLGETAAVLNRPFSAIWASDLGRAAETAEIIANVLGIDHVSVDPRLQEAHAGEWEGLTPTEIEEAWPGWLAEDRRPVTFEPFDQVIDRVVAALDDIVDGHGDQSGTPLVVAHSGVIRSIVRWTGTTDTSVPNLGGRWLQVDPVRGVHPDAVRVVGEFAPTLERTGESMPENPVVPHALGSG